MKKLILLVIICNACNSDKMNSTNNTPLSSSPFNQLMNDFHSHSLRLDPVNATFQGLKEYNGLFPNYISKEYLADKKNTYIDLQSRLNNIDKSPLSKQDALSHDILQWELQIALDELNFPFELTPIDQMWSINLVMGQLASGSSAQPFETVKDYENWFSRVNNYMIWCQTALANMREGIRKGIVLPKPLIKKVIPQFKILGGGKVEDHLFYKPALKIPNSIEAKKRTQIKKDMVLLVHNKLMPLHKEMADFFETEYLIAGRESSGVDVYPFGADLYDFMIKKNTTTNLTAQEIHDLGLNEVKRIRGEMEKVMQQLNYSGDLLSFFDHVRQNKDLMPFTSPKEVIDNFNRIHERMLPQLDELFELKPKAGFEVRQTEAFREASASAEYNPGSIDGTRPGVFYVPIPDVTAYNTYGDEDLFLHEAIPGHHYQISLQQENEELPDFRKNLWYSSYGEGWALYCESLGEELGLYKDPYQYFGMLGNEMHRAIRLVVDTGIHAFGWSREKAIEYSMNNEAESESSIISEIERYMAMPGQALSYKIGQLKILELRKKAEEQLGDKFNIKDFHNIMLKNGCVPLNLLEELTNDWINEIKEKN